MLRDLFLRTRSLLRRDAVERELQDELSFHLDQLTASYEQQGLPPDEARRRARLSLGGFDQIKEAHRDARGIRLFTDVGRDVRHALRQVLRAPGFAALAMLCLGLGIGVNTTIFSVVHVVMFQTLPVSDGDRIVSISRGDRPTMTYREYETLAARTRLLDGVTASFPLESDLEVDGVSEFVTSEIVPANYGPLLGVGLAAGRWFDDDRELEAVISHAVWQRRFNLSPDVLGRRIRSESQSYTVVGVALPAFSGTFAPLRTDIWVPLRTRPLIDTALDKADGPWQMRLLFGRLAASATAAQAGAEVNAIDAQLAREASRGSETPAPLVVDHVRGVPDPGLKQRSATLSVLLGAVVGLVLLIACVNVGNLLLVRGALRKREFAVRRALGASRLRLLRQLLTESLVLAAGGGICGIVLAIWTNRVLETSVPSAFGAFAVRLGLSVDWRAVAFAMLITIVTTILCGLWPAWRASRAASLVSFKSEIGAGAPRRPIGLVAQVVMSLVLLFVAGSFVQSLLRLYSIDPGFAVDGRLYAYTFLPAPPATPESRQAFYGRMLEQVRRVAACPVGVADELSAADADRPRLCGALGRRAGVGDRERGRTRVLRDDGVGCGRRPRVHSRRSVERCSGDRHQSKPGPPLVAGRIGPRRARDGRVQVATRGRRGRHCPRRRDHQPQSTGAAARLSAPDAAIRWSPGRHRAHRR